MLGVRFVPADDTQAALKKAVFTYVRTRRLVVIEEKEKFRTASRVGWIYNFLELGGLLASLIEVHAPSFRFFSIVKLNVAIQRFLESVGTTTAG